MKRGKILYLILIFIFISSSGLAEKKCKIQLLRAKLVNAELALRAANTRNREERLIVFEYIENIVKELKQEIKCLEEKESKPGDNKERR